MTDQVKIHRIDSPVRSKGQPRLSILIPYFRDNPSQLIKDLCQQDELNGVEILVYDDGTGDAELTSDVVATVKSQSHAMVSALIAETNHGRSFARNELMKAARSDWILYLDADMRPVTPDFIKNYVDVLSQDECDIIFGGFTVPERADDKDRELHRALSLVSDCLSLEDRQAGGPQFVCSSNLCVKKSVINAHTFDPDFSGWGWEDSEWAARVAKKYRLIHIDNPAIHLGLETTDTLLKRFKTSGPNYRLFTDKHPELAKTLSLYKISKTLGRLPGQSLFRPVLKGLVKLNLIPIRLRLFALKLWRASWYAEALS